MIKINGSALIVLGLVNLFTTCVDCFEYKEVLAAIITQLDLLELRFGLWCLPWTTCTAEGTNSPEGQRDCQYWYALKYIEAISGNCEIER
jgi:hypothetical protein